MGVAGDGAGKAAVASPRYSCSVDIIGLVLAANACGTPGLSARIALTPMVATIRLKILRSITW